MPALALRSSPVRRRLDDARPTPLFCSNQGSLATVCRIKPHPFAPFEWMIALAISALRAGPTGGVSVMTVISLHRDHTCGVRADCHFGGAGRAFSHRISWAHDFLGANAHVTVYSAVGKSWTDAGRTKTVSSKITTIWPNSLLRSPV